MFPMDEFRQFGSIISVTTDAILARCISLYEQPATMPVYPWHLKPSDMSTIIGGIFTQLVQSLPYGVISWAVELVPSLHIAGRLFSSVNCNVSINSKLQHAPPADPGNLNFFKFDWSNSPPLCKKCLQMPHCNKKLSVQMPHLHMKIMKH
jgi:hypothetical protein